MPLRSILLRESRNFILKTYIYPREGGKGFGWRGRGNRRRGTSETGLELLAGVSDIFHAGMFLSECTGTSGTIFECQPSLVWIISISRFKSGSIVSYRAAPSKVSLARPLDRQIFLLTAINSSCAQLNTSLTADF